MCQLFFPLFAASLGIPSNSPPLIPSMMTPPVEPFTYDDLTEVYRREQRSKYITEVRKDLYLAIKQCMDEMKRESEREFGIDQFSMRAKLAAHQLSKFQEKASQVFEFRMEKILAMALRSAQGNRVSPSRLTGEELEIFEKVSSLLKDRRVFMLEGPHLWEEEAAPSPPPGEPEAAEPVPDLEVSPAPPPASVPASITPTPAIVVPSGTSLEFVVLRILEDLPAFAGPDRNYELKKEDLVCLPILIAKALVARNKAVPVQTTFQRAKN